MLRHRQHEFNVALVSLFWNKNGNETWVFFFFLSFLLLLPLPPLFLEMEFKLILRISSGFYFQDIGYQHGKTIFPDEAAGKAFLAEGLPNKKCSSHMFTSYVDLAEKMYKKKPNNLSKSRCFLMLECICIILK